MTNERDKAIEVLEEMNNNQSRTLKEIEAIDLAISALQEVEELRTVLSAWHSIFGTTQLTHAQARLEVAEQSQERLVEENKQLRACHEAELGVCQEHCDVVTKLVEALENIRFRIGESGTVQEIRHRIDSIVVQALAKKGGER